MTTQQQLREQLADQQQILAAAGEVLGFLPEDEEALADKAAALAAIRELQAQLEAPPPPPPPPPPAAPSRVEESHLNLEVGDVVMAKWSEDRQFYQATIITVTGSSVDPLYTVRFTGYGNTETVRKTDIKVSETSKKRKAEAPPAGSKPRPPPGPPQQAKVITAAPAVDTTLAKKREPSLVSDGPTREKMAPKSLKNQKQAEKQKASWNNWQQKGAKLFAAAGLPKQKDSQFRVKDGPNARVGFNSSGKGMTSTETGPKSKYIWDDTEQT